MSRSQPGSARAGAARGEAPAFASQPGTATAAAAAAFAPPPELAEAGASGAAAYDPEGAGPPSHDPECTTAAAYDAGAAAAHDPEGAAAAGYAAGSTDAAGAYGAAGAATYYGSAAAVAGQDVPGSETQYAGGAEQDAAAAGATAEGAAPGAEAYSPLAYLQQLEAHLSALQQQRRGVEQQLAAAAAAAYQHMSQRLGAAGTGVPLPPDVPALVDELAVLQSVRQYLAYLQELQALARHSEKAVRALQQQQQQAEGGGDSAAAFLQAAAEAVDSFSNAVGYAIAIRQLTGTRGRGQLQELGGRPGLPLVARV